MSTESIVPHILNLDAEARQMAERMKERPKNRYGIPLYHLQPRERPAVEKTQEFCQTANMHIIQLIHEAESVHPRGYLVEFPEINDPWEQDALKLTVHHLRSKGNSVTRYPWVPEDVLYVDDLIIALKDLIQQGAAQASQDDGEAQGTTVLTDAMRIMHLEDQVAVITEALKQRNML